jgi:hypothetical protein
MTKLEQLIAKRDQLDAEIRELETEESENRCPIQKTQSEIVELLKENGITFSNDEDDFPHGAGCILPGNVYNNIHINVDNSVRVSNTYHRTTNVDTTVAGGDSALSFVGKFIEGLF